MSDEPDGNESFQDRIRWIAREVSRSVEQLADLDVDEIARAIGVDAERAKEFADGVARWLSEHADAVGGDAFFAGSGARAEPGESERRRGPGPHPLDLPSEAQGLALSALDSGRWSVEPGSSLLTVHGDGSAPEDPVGIVGELRARDWIDAGGMVTLLGHRALSRWSSAPEAG